MSRTIAITVIQPPSAIDGTPHDEIVEQGLHLVQAAGEEGTDLILLPEYFNVFGLSSVDALDRAEDGYSALAQRIEALCARYQVYVIYPNLERRGGQYVNSAWIYDRTGKRIGKYDKVHTTAQERREYGIRPGDHYPVFELDRARIGIMTCYDGHFPEVARILTLKGAEILCYPALERSHSEMWSQIQVRARALDNAVIVARSSYGVPRDRAWKPGMMIGGSCIVDPEGTIIAHAGHHMGWVTARVDLAYPRLKHRSYGDQPGVARDFLFADRRPETYGALCEPFSFQTTEKE